MKWYWWLVIAIVIIVIISVVVYKTKTKKSNGLVEGSECFITTNSTPTTRTVGGIVDIPVKIVPEKGIVVNGVCVKR